MIERFSEQYVRQIAKHFPALVVTGARQVGKTTLLRKAFPHHTYVTLDLPSTAESAETEPEAFLARYPAPVLIDEIQYAPKLFRTLKRAIDADRHRMGSYILTGSQKFSIMEGVSDSLAGRVAVLELEGLSYAEIGAGVPIERLITRGSFPELWRDPSLPAEIFHASYLATYLERDVRQILGVTSLRDFERFIRACAARNGQLVDKSTLALEVGVAAKTIAAWLGVLVASNQIVLLEPWFANFGKRLVKTPKLYFCDTGLVCFLLGVGETDLGRSPFVGSLWETLVFAELRKATALSTRPGALWFYRDSAGTEVDFLRTGGGRAELFECKWKESAEASDTRSMQSVLRAAHAKKAVDFTRSEGYVVCRTRDPHALGDSLRAISLTELTRIASAR